jgi:uncharacterized membrane protein YfcA
LTSFAKLHISMNYLGLLAVGLVAGVFAGILGIGGGLIIVPALLYIFKVPVLEATGTSLAALIPPVGLLGAIEYYKSGHINIAYAALLALGLFVGSYFGARMITGISPALIHRIYGGFLLVVGIRMLVSEN